jgi:hypothetical protein
MGQLFDIKDDGTIVRGGTNPKQPKKSKTWLIVLLLCLAIGGGLSIGYYVNNTKTEDQQMPDEQVTTEVVSDFPNEHRIKELINNYYNVFKNKQYYKLDDFFAETVFRYFAENNVTGTSIKDRYKKYCEETLGVKTMSFSVHWQSFEQKPISNGMISISFILDYYLDSQRYGNQKYELKIDMNINKDYKIIGINEKTINRYNL